MLVNPELWQNVENFELSSPFDEFGFITRLEYENNWTIGFAEKAVQEYKKFMFLAAVSDEMVSPSEIVDTVWHLHLIYSESYKEFCRILGKNIEHKPSTHNRKEKDKYAKAYQYTLQQYQLHFGKQPSEFWEAPTMLSTLELHLAQNYNVKNLMIVWAISTFILFFLIKPILVTIDNPDFLYGYLGIGLVLLFMVDFSAKIAIRSFIVELNKKLVFKEFKTPELLYMKGNMPAVFLGYLNDLVRNKMLIIRSNTLYQSSTPVSLDARENAIIDAVDEKFGTNLHTVYKNISEKRIFRTIKKSNDYLLGFLYKTTEFRKKIYPWIFILCVWLSVGYCRLILGFIRNKPVGLLLFILGVMLLVYGIVFFKIHFLELKKQVINVHKKHFIKTPLILSEHKSASSDYLLKGSLMAGLVGVWLVSLAQTETASSSSDSFNFSPSSSDSSSSGGSCGSSCGSSCGGCGGGGD